MVMSVGAALDGPFSLAVLELVAISPDLIFLVRSTDAQRAERITLAGSPNSQSSSNNSKISKGAYYNNCFFVFSERHKSISRMARLRPLQFC